MIKTNWYTASCKYYECSGLTSVTIGNGVTRILALAFSDCQKLTFIKVEDGNEKFDSRNNCNAIIETATNTLCIGCKNTVIPNSVTSIGSEAFYGCTSLTSITIPNNVISVDRWAFQNCSSLTAVNIGSSISSISDEAFADCLGLYDVYCYAENVPTTVFNVFNNSPIASATLHVPGASLGAYSTTAPWSGFGTIMPIETIDDRSEQTLDLTELPTLTSGNAAYTLPEQTDQGLALTWSIADATIASISGYQLTPLSGGTTTVTATQAGNSQYLPFTKSYTLTVADETLLNNRLYAETVKLRAGASKTFGLKLDNTMSFIACEFYLQLPEGVRIETDEDGYLIAELVSGRINRHSLEVNHVGNGLYHFLCYSSRNNAFVGNSGDLFTLTVTCDENVLSDTYTATIKDIMFSDQDKQQVDLLDSSFDVVVTDIIPGDANGDEKINVMDVVEIVSYIMSNASDSFVFAAADIDENGTINVMDLVNVVSLIMTNTNQPTAAPRRRSAAPKQADAVTDELTVADFSIAAGETKEVSMVLDNPVNDFIAFEFWMSLPDGVRIAYDGEGELMATLNASRADGHDFIVEEPNGDGIYHFLCYSISNKTFKGNSGELVNLTITCADDATAGDATGTVYDILFSDPDKNEVDLANLTFNISVTDAGTGGYVLDESSSEAIKAGTYGRVILKRSFAEGWNTVCLPFAIGDIEEVFGTGAKAYEFDDFDDGELGFVPVTSFEPCTPYVIYVPTAITDDIILTDVYIDEEDTEAGYTRVNRNYYFRGSFAPVASGEWTKKNSTDDIFGLTADGRIRKAGSGAYIKGFRAYFDLPEGAAVKGFIFDDDATGIDNVNANLNESIFNLAGQRLKKAQKGINIINGKKILK